MELAFFNKTRVRVMNKLSEVITELIELIVLDAMFDIINPGCLSSREYRKS